MPYDDEKVILRWSPFNFIGNRALVNKLLRESAEASETETQSVAPSELEVPAGRVTFRERIGNFFDQIGRRKTRP